MATDNVTGRHYSSGRRGSLDCIVSPNLLVPPLCAAFQQPGGMCGRKTHPHSQYQQFKALQMARTLLAMPWLPSTSEAGEQCATYTCYLICFQLHSTGMSSFTDCSLTQCSYPRIHASTSPVPGLCYC
eukprot:scpid47346/ scgid23059/ 